MNPYRFTCAMLAIAVIHVVLFVVLWDQGEGQIGVIYMLAYAVFLMLASFAVQEPKR